MIVGLTGGICTGKSVASAALSRIGVHIVDCDVIAHFLSDYNPEVRRAIRDQFGSQAFRPYGALDRGLLAEIVFHDASQRARLETILHPSILDIVGANLAASRAEEASLVIVIPLLFELGLQQLFDETWLVSCDVAAQFERLQSRGGYTSEEAQARIAAQWPLDKKASMASRVLNNDATIGDFERRVISLWESLNQA